jgi:hypothetical protein
MPPVHDDRKQGFQRRMAPLTTHVAINILNTLTPGVNWRGSSKSHLAEAFAAGEHGLSAVNEMGLVRAITAYLQRHYGLL